MPRKKNPPVKSAARVYHGQVTADGEIRVFAGNVPLPAANAKLGFDWGKDPQGVPNRQAPPSRSPEVSHLALALAVDVLDDEREAAKIHQRLKHRTVLTWSRGQPWSISARELQAHIDNIRQVEIDTAQTRMMVANQPAPVVYEGGGMAGAGIKRSDHDEGPGPIVSGGQQDPRTKQLQQDALAKLTPEERRALGL